MNISVNRSSASFGVMPSTTAAAIAGQPPSAHVGTFPMSKPAGL